MSYQIEISPSARQEIRALPAYVRAQALQLIDELGRNPRPARAKELQDRQNIYRIWLAGRWRIVYAVDDALIVVTRWRGRADASAALERDQQVDALLQAGLLRSFSADLVSRYARLHPGQREVICDELAGRLLCQPDRR